MSILDTLKKVWFSLYDSHRIILLDYPVCPEASYPVAGQRPHEGLFHLIHSRHFFYEQLLVKVRNYQEGITSIRQHRDIINEVDPGWNNGYLPGLDIVMLYVMLAEYKPRRYLEIGSGTSTRVAHKSRRDNALHHEIISIDPSPRQPVEKAADIVYRENLRAISSGIFEALDENDIIFLDGTHTLYPASDVMWFFMEVLPRLKKGVIIQVHDIYLPYDYPAFMLRRYYNEQYLLGALLLNNPGKFEILCPNYFISVEKSLSRILDPLWQLQPLQNVEKHGGSFWFRVQ